jgi:integrase
MTRYPAPWRPTGHGSYRLVAPGRYELTWRPAGHSGPQLRRRVDWSLADVRRFLTAQAINRQRLAAGLAPRLDWREALDQYRRHLQSRDCSRAYVADLAAVVQALQLAVKVDLCRLQPAHLESWRQARVAALRARRRPGWARTANKETVMLSGFLRYCVRVLRCLERNPADPLQSLAHQPKAARDLEPHEYAQVWHAAEPPLRDLLDFLLLTGCRFGEAQKMRRQDLQGDVWVMPDRKAGDELHLPLAPAVLEVLARQSLHPDGRVWHRHQGRSRGPQGVPFLAGAPITPEWFNPLVAARCEAVRVRPFTAHALRHAAGRWLRRAGVQLDQIQVLLGHSSVTTTEIYAKSEPGVAKRVQEVLCGVRDTAIQALMGA